MRSKQIPACSNCRDEKTDALVDPCLTCDKFSNWQTKRGSKPGADRKEGAGRTPFEDRGQLKQSMILSFTESDITKAGGYKKVKADLEKTFYDIAKQSLARRCMYCEKEIKANEAIVNCKECTE